MLLPVCCLEFCVTPCLSAWTSVLFLSAVCSSVILLSARSGVDVLGTHVLEYIFKVLLLMEIMGHVLVLILSVLRFYDYI